MDFKRKISILSLVSMLIINSLQTIKVSATTIVGPIETIRPSTTNDINKIIFANGRYYIVGGGGNEKSYISSSLDFVTWEDVANIADVSDENSSSDLDSLKDIKYANGVFIAVGSSKHPNSNGNKNTDGGVSMARSTDGINWTGIRDPRLGWLNSVEYSTALNLWVATGWDADLNGFIFTSSDNGVSWTKRTSATNKQIFSVIYAIDRFVAVGLDGSIQVSGDGISWVLVNTTITETLVSINSPNGKLVALGLLGGVYESSDGWNWFEKDLGLVKDYKFSQIIYENNQYIIVGGGINGKKEAVAIVSSNFYDWEKVTIDEGSDDLLTSVIYNDDKFRMTSRKMKVHSTTFTTEVPPSSPFLFSSNEAITPLEIQSATSGNKNIGQAFSVYKTILNEVDSTKGNKSLNRIIEFLSYIGDYNTYKPLLSSWGNKLW